uniref:Uncharacterized protein n=1 Tax=Rhizophora mucronata TaxID=61149 RepID=A0A2P2IIK4_RHIMU
MRWGIIHEQFMDLPKTELTTLLHSRLCQEQQKCNRLIPTQIIVTKATYHRGTLQLFSPLFDAVFICMFITTVAITIKKHI